MTGPVWIFGYGSLIWRPDFEFIASRPARANGWTRRFWQGSHDHRGLPHAPGRVVTIIARSRARCDGMAYLVSGEVAAATFDTLDHREKNGYERHSLAVTLAAGEQVSAQTYIAPPGNHAYLGPAGVAEMAAQIGGSAGPSGRNADYLFDLARALRDLDAVDAHVFELEAAVRAWTHHNGGA